jgi:hypothetical protein
MASRSLSFGVTPKSNPYPQALGLVIYLHLDNYLTWSGVMWSDVK